MASAAGPREFQTNVFSVERLFLKMVCRMAYDSRCGCLWRCLVIVSPGVGDELRERLQLWSQMGKGGRGTRTREEENENRNVAEAAGAESERLGKQLGTI